MDSENSPRRFASIVQPARHRPGVCLRDRPTVFGRREGDNTMTVRSKWFISLCVSFFAAPTLQAAVRWRAFNSNNDIKQWQAAQCGGQPASSCPCGNNNWCSTSSATNPSGGFLSYVADPAGSSDTVLKVPLQPGWLYNGLDRNELELTQDNPPPSEPMGGTHIYG